MPTAPHPASCRGCPLDQLGKGFAKIDGYGNKWILVVPEALGESDMRDSLPLRPYSQAGSIFERALLMLGLTRNDVVIRNIVNCRPPNNVLSGAPYAQGAINHCRPNLEEVFNKYDIKVILALGSVALESLTGLHGKKLNLSSVRGYPIWSEEFQCPVIATYHPAFIARGQKNLLGVFYRDFHRAIQIANGTLKLGSDFYLNPQEEYNCDYHTIRSASELEIEIGLIKPDDVVAFDIETEQSAKAESEDTLTGEKTRITQFQYSLRKGHARIISWRKEYVEIVNRLMNLPNIKIGWNSWLFDEPVLNDHGITIAEPHHDLMSLAHHYEPDLPMGLQYVASLYGWKFHWKHLAGEDIEFYGGCDTDVLHYIVGPLVSNAARDGVLGCSEEEFYENSLVQR